MGEFVMPSLGADMESGTLLEWFVKPGDTVKRGDIVALVDTSKAEIEVEIFQDGVVDELLVPAGTRVPVGAVLATIRPVGAEAEAPVGAAQVGVPMGAEVVVPVGAAEPVEAEVAVPGGGPVPRGAAAGLRTPDGHHRRRVSPLARRAAEQLGVDLSAVRGSGPGGAIGRADVERAAGGRPAPAPEPEATAVEGPAVEAPAVGAPAVGAPAVGAPAATVPADRATAMRAAVGALMARSKREIPHYYLQLEIDLSAPLQRLHEANLSRAINERLLPSALLLRAVARAAAETPEMNGFWADGSFQAATAVHLGVAIALRGGGLIAPALHDADRLSLDEIMRGVRDLVQRARAGRLRSSEMSDPTITVTNLGDRGVDAVHGVIYPPQVALVGFGAVRERPWAVDGMLGIRPVVTATLAADHRVSEGHAGGRFLSLIERHLQQPEDR